MNFDLEIKLSGVPASVMAPAFQSGELAFQDGDLGFVSGNTYIFYGHIGKLGGKGDPDNIYQAGYYLPTDCGVAPGDLVLIDGEYYLMMSMEKVFDNGTLACYRGMIFKCNSVISIYGYDTATKKPDTLIKSGVHCLITQDGGADVAADKAMVNNEYKGKITPFKLYLRSTEGLVDSKTTPKIIDYYGNKFRVLDEFDPLKSRGIMQTQVMIEGK